MIENTHDIDKSKQFEENKMIMNKSERIIYKDEEIENILAKFNDVVSMSVTRRASGVPFIIVELIKSSSDREKINQIEGIGEFCSFEEVIVRPVYIDRKLLRNIYNEKKQRGVVTMLGHVGNESVFITAGHLCSHVGEKFYDGDDHIGTVVKYSVSPSIDAAVVKLEENENIGSYSTHLMIDGIINEDLLGKIKDRTVYMYCPVREKVIEGSTVSSRLSILKKGGEFLLKDAIAIKLDALEGTSGSLIYVTLNGKNYGLGILVGTLKGDYHKEDGITYFHPIHRVLKNFNLSELNFIDAES